jgi:pseudouridine-5'-phosphate glycosidase
MTGRIRVRDDVAEAIAGRRPVVALESTLFVHGLPRPTNLVVASQIERIVVAEGAIPATIGLIGGEAVIGLTPAEVERLSAGGEVPKASVRDIPIVLGRGGDAATTVASTAVLAARAGIRVFATGGLGGVHRGARASWDESADLTTLATTPITVVSAGVKSILDVGATLERLETLSVSVVGFRTSRFPGFYLAGSGFPLDWCVESEEEIAAFMSAQRSVGSSSALLVVNALPPEEQLDPELHDRVLADSLAAAEREGIRGKDVTPFLLDYFHRETEEASLRVNTTIIYNNARLAARIARAWAHLKGSDPFDSASSRLE